jgi:hypothetical protein
MDWHAKNKSGQDMLCNRTDFEGMKHIENTWPEKLYMSYEVFNLT